MFNATDVINDVDVVLLAQFGKLSKMLKDGFKFNTSIIDMG